MRVCTNCNKSNDPTRKFCIRCGKSLITKQKKAKPKPAETPVVPLEPEAPPPEMQETSTDDKWVRPSEVSKDRMRSASGAKRMSELEKAQAAFAKAESVGIDEEEGSGVIETRMLRASEVKELLEGPGMMEGSETPGVSEPGMTPEMAPQMPTSEQIEEQLLGSKSAFVTPQTPDPEPAPIEATSVPADGETTGFSAVTNTAAPVEAKPVLEEHVSVCHNCGEVVNIDTFEYPKEVYSAMGAARLKDARFFLVQGKYDEAQKIVRIARAFYVKAEDTEGVAQIDQVVESIARRD
ncbi:MAG: zinc ribbon domain-containing protein [Candidatus Thorarchaeota archaeon]|jgi:hypothetical protein